MVWSQVRGNSQDKNVIEYIIPRVNLRNDLKTYDQYCLSEKLNDDDEDKNFEAWSKYIQDKLMQIN